MATFNAQEHLMQLKNGKSSSDYLEVKWRLVWFRTECPSGTIETELVHLDLDRETQEEAFVWNKEKNRSEKVTKIGKGIAIFKATVKDGKGGVATATKMEKAAAFGDWLEKAETGAIGRALAALGYGTQFTGDELSEGHRIVDSPVEHYGTNESTSNHPTNRPSDANTSTTRREARTGDKNQGASTTSPTRVATASDSQSTASAHSSKGMVKSTPELRRARKLYDLAIEKGALKQGAAADAWLQLCGDLIGANVSHLEHLTNTRMDTIETKLQAFKAS